LTQEPEAVGDHLLLHLVPQRPRAVRQQVPQLQLQAEAQELQRLPLLLQRLKTLKLNFANLSRR
jgi:hypothetical protein